jgi:hypothetical protein
MKKDEQRIILILKDETVKNIQEGFEYLHWRSCMITKKDAIEMMLKLGAAEIQRFKFSHIAKMKKYESYFSANNAEG